MCKHTKFDRNKWAPCVICLEERRRADVIKNQDKLKAIIQQLVKEAEEIEAQGGKARYEREEIEHRQHMLDRYL